MYQINYRNQTLNASRVIGDIAYRINAVSQINKTNNVKEISNIKVDVLTKEGEVETQIGYWYQTDGVASNMNYIKAVSDALKKEIFNNVIDIINDVTNDMLNDNPLIQTA